MISQATKAKMAPALKRRSVDQGFAISWTMEGEDCRSTPVQVRGMFMKKFCARRRVSYGRKRVER